MRNKIDLKIKAFIASMILFFTVGFSFSQMEFPEDLVKVKFSVEQNDKEVFVVADVSIAPKWHINASKLPKGSFGIPTTFKLISSKNFKTIGGVTEPKPIEKYDETVEEHLSYHEGKIKMKQKIAVLSASDFEITGTFNYQTCDEFKCLPDYTYDFKVKVKGIEQESDIETIASSSSGNEPYNLNNVLALCLDVARPMIYRTRIEVVQRLQSSLPSCTGDLVMVRQAVLNLIYNACQAMEKEKERRLYIETYSDGSAVHFAVEDTGPGVPHEQRSQIFNALFSTKVNHGTGLGLSVVQSVMHRHGGEVYLAEGVAGNGARFVLRFPIR